MSILHESHRNVSFSPFLLEFLCDSLRSSGVPIACGFSHRFAVPVTHQAAEQRRSGFLQSSRFDVAPPELWVCCLFPNLGLKPEAIKTRLLRSQNTAGLLDAPASRREIICWH